MEQLGKQLYTELFEYPDRYFVEAENPDRDYLEFYPHLKDEEIPPHFVDLGEEEFGWCSCRDYRINLRDRSLAKQTSNASLVNEEKRQCKHILAAIKFKSRITTKPKPMPLQIKL